jgi:LytR cell envelope-related transcriptional attenuator
VEFSAPAPPVHPLVRQWRTATIVASGVAAFELVLLLIVGIAIVSKPLAAHAKEAGITEATGIAKVKVASHPEPKAATLRRSQTSVLVLNGNGIAGAAATTASRARARGYVIRGTGNAAHNYGRSVVMYRPGRLPEAKRLARDLGGALVGPLDGLTPRQLHGAQVVIVLGT